MFLFKNFRNPVPVIERKIFGFLKKIDKRPPYSAGLRDIRWTISGFKELYSLTICRNEYISFVIDKSVLDLL